MHFPRLSVRLFLAALLVSWPLLGATAETKDSPPRYKYPFYSSSTGVSLCFDGAKDEIHDSFSIGDPRIHVDTETGVNSSGYAYVSLKSPRGRKTTLEFEDDVIVWIRSTSNYQQPRLYKANPREVDLSSIEIHSYFDEQTINKDEPVEILDDLFGLNFRNYRRLVITEPFNLCLDCDKSDSDCGPQIYTIAFDPKTYTVSTIEKRKRPGSLFDGYVATQTLQGTGIKKAKRPNFHRCKHQSKASEEKTSTILNNFQLKYTPYHASPDLSHLSVQEVPANLAHRITKGTHRSEIDSKLGFPTLDYDSIQLSGTEKGRAYSIFMRLRDNTVTSLECHTPNNGHLPYESRLGTPYSGFRTLTETAEGELAINAFPNFKLESGMLKSEISEKLGFDLSLYSKITFTMIEDDSDWSICGEGGCYSEIVYKLYVTFEDGKAVCAGNHP